jgi:hypothetical protein
MPERSSIQSFINALQSGQTTITRGLKQLWDDRAALPNITSRAATLTLTPLDAEVDAALRARGLATKEIDHINEWSNGEKVKVRRALVVALNSNPQRDVEFSWELYNGSASVAQIDNLNGTGTIRVRFRSPRANIQTVADEITGEVNVQLEEMEENGGSTSG